MTEATSAMPGLPRDAGRREGISWTSILQVIVLAALVLVVYWPSLDYMVHKWRSDGDWSHGWLVPLFSLYFLGTRREQLRDLPKRMNLLGLVLMVASLAAYYLAAFKQFSYPQRLTLVPFLIGLVWFMCGWRIIRVAWFPIAYLVLAIPLPEWIYFELTYPLRRIASVVAGTLLNLLPDVYTEVSGVVVEYEHLGTASALNIEEACSGMRLMMAFIALGVAVAYLGDRKLWHRVVLVLACVPIAVFCNMIRVFVTGVIHVYGYRDLSQGTAHELLGLAMLPIALGLFALVGWVLNHLFVESPDGENEAERGA
ncbi:MAG: exosortase/archaeosortase family protein [Phycisphaerales bacterium]|nr:exosortase/archaeosortase family protein [Phycisphaerales bacterium]